MTGLNWVDLVILILLLSAAVHGYRQGAVIQVFSYLGFGLGLVAGARLGPVLSQFVQSPVAKMGVVIASFFGMASVLGTVGRITGARMTWGVVRRAKLGPVNSIGGVGVSTLATALTVWLIGGLLAQVGLGSITPGFQQSQIMRGLTSRLPPAPSVFSRIQSFLPSGFPPVFAELEPSPAPRVPVAAGPQVRAAVRAAAPSVLRITSVGCGRITSGSGFVAAPGLVITNAHVVAGVDRPLVQDSRGSRRTSVVLFDPRLDVAVLRTSGLAGAPLTLMRGVAGRGQVGAVLGYPGGGPFVAQPGAVRSVFENAVGRDIYSRDLVSRDVYQLDSSVHPGNSGGPFVSSNGQVIGVVFASSLMNPDIAYALTSTEVALRLDKARQTSGAVDTGPCPA